MANSLTEKRYVYEREFQENPKFKFNPFGFVQKKVQIDKE